MILSVILTLTSKNKAYSDCIEMLSTFVLSITFRMANEKTSERPAPKNKNGVHSLSDVYVRALLRRSGFSKESIEQYPVLIKLKRAMIKLKRTVKQKKNGTI